MQQQAATVVDSSAATNGLEIMLLDSTLSNSDISNCVDAHNSEWYNPNRGQFFQLNPDIMMQRLRSGELFLGGFNQDNLVTYLETMSHYVEIPDMPTNPDIETVQRIANYVSNQLEGNYFTHAPNGRWPDRPQNANVIRFVSINTLPEERDAGYAGQIIENVKSLMRLAGQERPEQLRDIAIGLTDTPVLDLPQKFHFKHGAFKTGYREIGFRPNYKEPDVERFCYFAPGFIAPPGITRSA